MNKEERAIQAYMRVVYSNTGYNHLTVIQTLYCLITNKIKKNDLTDFLLGAMKVDGLMEDIKKWSEEKEFVLFTRKYAEPLDLEGFSSTRDRIQDIIDELGIKIKKGEEFTGKIPVKDILRVTKSISKRRTGVQYSKNMLNNPHGSNTPREYRQAFIEATQNTQERYRRKPQRYSVSYDEDKPVFYTSMEGRLAKLPYYKFKKYVKEGKIQEDGERRAREVIPDGTFVRVGKYIERNYPKWPMITKEALQRAFEEIKPCHMVIDRNFEKAYNPIYNDHQDTDGDKASNYSCMSGRGPEAQEFYGGIHGCSVVRFETEDGKQVGRCIMYEYKGQRHFIRIYGLYDYHRTMINLLQNEMKPNDLFGRNECIDGMELETDWDWDTHLMYLDGNHYGYREVTKADNPDNPKYVVSTNYDCDCKTTNEGTIGDDDDDYYVCDHCGHRVHSDDAFFVDDYVFCCTDCAHEDGWYACDYCGEWEHEDNGFWIDDNFYCDSDCARADGNEKCLFCGEWHSKDDILDVGDGDYYCNDECAMKDGWKICDHCESWVHEDYEIEIDDKIYCSEYCAEKAGYVKIGEEWKRAEDEEEVKETEEPKEVVNEG